MSMPQAPVVMLVPGCGAGVELVIGVSLRRLKRVRAEHAFVPVRLRVRSWSEFRFGPSCGFLVQDMDISCPADKGQLQQA